MKGSNTNISEQIEYLEALTEALPRENYMKLYDIICEAEDANDAKERVMEFFEFSEAQAQYVLDMKIETFSLDEAKRLKNEYRELDKIRKVLAKYADFEDSEEECEPEWKLIGLR